ncbi:MAG: site-specific DNA-methyltransferase [Thermoplasmata archaeon]|nr:site-specific DNA-methyltransferase [Thermoplasmata archaeon]
MRSSRGTKTSTFGSPGRINHDSSEFYNSRLYDELPVEKDVEFIENRIPGEFLNRILCKSSEKMEELPDASIHLMVTSPPYNVGKEYDENLSLGEYREFLSRVWREVYRVLVPGGRVCVNVANLGRKPYIPLHAFIIEDMLNIGFLMRGEIIWNKGSSASPSTAWGSWLSPKNPVLRDVHEYILVFSKDTFSRKNHKNGKVTMSRDEFLELTKSVWTFNAESAKKIGHPAPFPLTLPLNCIKLYTFENDVVLDPFMGSGTTAVAALMSNRYFVGYETEPEYIDLADSRIRKVLDQRKQKKLEDMIPAD